MKNSLIKRLLLSAFTFVGSISGKYVVCDLGHVLIGPNKLNLAFSHLGIFNILGSSEKDIRRIMADIQTTAQWFDGNNQLMMREENTTVMGDTGKPLSTLHCDYLAGMKTSAECFEQLQASIELLDSVGYFKSKRERRLAEKVLEVVYDPEVCARYMEPINKGVKLLQKCSEKLDEHGNPANEMMILSNWDKESFPLMYEAKRMQRVFKYFNPENIFISGAFGHEQGNKPYPWVFNFVTKAKNALPSDFVFIDDQIANVEAARRCGWHAIWLQDGDYKQVELELQKLGVL